MFHRRKGELAARSHGYVVVLRHDGATVEGSAEYRRWLGPVNPVKVLKVGRVFLLVAEREGKR
jgi:hypothetical protein